MTVPEEFQPTPQSVQAGPERRIVRALGGSYVAKFNYKDEIMRHMQSGRRCYACLEVMEAGWSFKAWAMDLCGSCLYHYTIRKYPYHE